MQCPKLSLLLAFASITALAACSDDADNKNGSPVTEISATEPTPGKSDASTAGDTGTTGPASPTPDAATSTTSDASDAGTTGPTNPSHSDASATTSDASTSTTSDASVASDAGTVATAETFTQVYAILSAKCAPCHTKFQAGKLGFTTKEEGYAALVGVDAKGPLCTENGGKRVAPGNAAGSLLYTKVDPSASRCGDVMPPKDAPKLSAAEITTIKNWINAGANND